MVWHYSKRTKKRPCSIVPFATEDGEKHMSYQRLPAKYGKRQNLRFALY